MFCEVSSSCKNNSFHNKNLYLQEVERLPAFFLINIGKKAYQSRLGELPSASGALFPSAGMEPSSQRTTMLGKSLNPLSLFPCL